MVISYLAPLHLAQIDNAVPLIVHNFCGKTERLESFQGKPGTQKHSHIGYKWTDISSNSFITVDSLNANIFKSSRL